MSICCLSHKGKAVVRRRIKCGLQARLLFLFAQKRMFLFFKLFTRYNASFHEVLQLLDVFEF